MRAIQRSLRNVRRNCDPLVSGRLSSIDSSSFLTLVNWIASQRAALLAHYLTLTRCRIASSFADHSGVNQLRSTESRPKRRLELMWRRTRFLARRLPGRVRSAVFEFAIDRARRREAAKRGGAAEHEPLEESRLALAARRDEIAPGIPRLVAGVEVTDTFVNREETSVAVEFLCHIRAPACTLRIIDRFKVDAAGLIVEQENFFDPRDVTHPGWQS